MRTCNMKRLLPALVGLLLTMAGVSANASTTWNYDLVGQCDPATSQGTYVANCANLTAPVLDLTMSGWSTGTGTISTPTTGTTFSAARIYDWGTAGLGVVAGNEDPNATGPHSADNRYGTDSVLLAFTSAIGLNSVKIGWNGTDNGGTYDTGESSDISVLAYQGATPPANAAPTMNGQSISQLLASGWQLVGNYGQVGLLANNTATIASTVTSSWWLISAYNSSYGSAASSSGYALTSGNDYFKLLSVAGSIASPPPVGQTPEPGSIILAGLGLLGLLASRRRLKGEWISPTDSTRSV